MQESLISIEKYFGVSQTRIAFLALFEVKEKGYISPRKFKEAIKYIENFVFAYSVVVKNQANIYESRFSNFAIKLRKTESKSETNSIIDEMLYEKFNESFPSYSDFSEKFKVLKFSKRKLGSNIITKYIMKNISLHIEGEDTPRNNSSIEHIIAEDKNNSDTLLIGNLISLEQNINNSAEDLSFDEKLSLYEDSKYSQVQKFCQEYKNKDFTEDTIQKRSEELSQYYYTKILDKPITMGIQVQRI